MKIQTILICIFFSLVMSSCGKNFEQPEPKGENEPSIELEESDDKTIETRNEKLRQIYENYVAKYNGEARHDLGLIGPVELLRHLDELPQDVLDKITLIGVSMDAFEEVPDLSGLRNIERIYFAGNGLKRVDSLQNIPVKNLSITANPLETIEPLAKNPYIEMLSLQGSSVEYLPDMSLMTSLNTLNLVWTNLRSLDNIETVPTPINLYIIECTDIEDIDALKYAKLQRLYISGNGRSPLGGVSDKIGLYDKFKDWFDENLLVIRENNPGFELHFSFDDGDL
jgi:hypothetical protein